MDQLTRDEMQRGQYASAYELVESLRPRWLRSRGPESILGENVEVQVYLNDQRLGGVSTLRTINLADVMFMQFIDPVSAGGRWGPDHHNGAILISTRGR